MQIVALLRGVTPTGKNRIPKMADLVELLQNEGFKQVSTYIQSGNVILETELSISATKAKIHETILRGIGADLAVIIKTQDELARAIRGNPFDANVEYDRIHLVFTNDRIDKHALQKVFETELFGEVLDVGADCFYLYLPRDASKKRLNTNFLEKKLGITATMRKLNVIQALYNKMI